MIIGSYAFILSQIFFNHCYNDAFQIKNVFKKSYTFLQYSSRPSLTRYRDPQTNTPIYLKLKSHDNSLVARVKQELSIEKKDDEAGNEEDNSSTITKDDYEISARGDPFFSQSISEESNMEILQNDDDSNTDDIGTNLARNCLIVKDSNGKGKGLFTTVNIEEGIYIGAKIYVHCILECISYM